MNSVLPDAIHRWGILFGSCAAVIKPVMGRKGQLFELHL